MAAHPPTDTVERMIAAGLVPPYETPVIGDVVLILLTGFARETDGEPGTGIVTAVEPGPESVPWHNSDKPVLVQIDEDIPEVVEYAFAASELALISPAEDTPLAERPAGAPGTAGGPAERPASEWPPIAWHPEVAALAAAWPDSDSEPGEETDRGEAGGDASGLA